MRSFPARLLLALLLPLAGLAACTGVRPIEAPPEAVYEGAEIPGYPGVRVWGDEPAPDTIGQFATFVEQIRARAEREGGLPNDNRLDSLVLSGGGSDGPFGAGLLVGWTEAGTRPEFTIVTGISAGALIAPFAFLGPEYDEELTRFTVDNSTETLISLNILAGILDGVGLIDNSKLQQQLRGLITPGVVELIAEEHDKGRRLTIGTTNLDAQRPVFWRIDEIAKIARDDGRLQEAADLITRIMIASASIPGVFPPQFFVVDALGGRYSEMHVDGGVTHQLFFLPQETRFENVPADIAEFVGRGTIYVVRNTKLDPEYAPLELGLFQVAGRSVSTMIKFGGRADVVLLENQARQAGFGLKITAVPRSFDMDEEELFDPVYMQALYEVGYEMGAGGTAWTTDLPPRLETVADLPVETLPDAPRLEPLASAADTRRPAPTLR